MKKVSWLFVLLLSFFQALSQKNINTVFLPDNTFEVIGKIKNYKPTKENGFVRFRRYALTGVSRDTAILINNAGEFSCQLRQPFEGDFALLFKNIFINLYASPSEKIRIEIDEVMWGMDENRVNSIFISGKSAPISRSIVAFQEIKKTHKFINNPDYGDKNQTDEQMTKVTVAQMNETLALLNEYIVKHNIKEEKFIQWSRNKIIFSAGSYIAFSCFAGKLNKTISHEQLNAYLNFISHDMPNALRNSEYYHFMSLLSGDYQIIININPLYQKTLKANGNSSVITYLEKVDQYFSGLEKELLYYIRFDSKNKDSELNVHRFSSVIKDAYLEKLLLAEQSKGKDSFMPYNVLERIQKHPAGDSLSQILTALSKKNKDSYLFIDFWGSWCGPCMLEMPLYPQLIEKIKDKPIVFVFFSVDTHPEKIKEVKEKYNIKGEFIPLTDNDTKIFNNVLQFSSYPSHFIVDSNGNLVSNKVPHLGSGGQLNSQLIEHISKTVAAK